ncbi:hypothetical protein MHC_02535 [Mycoplasma haemocanis str. Illinois]|uniref:Uncharacterized protein n=1 Tax=Mycoplasma haemocanis (strain Illinois) TaxID=1111676 RepID=H6N6U9_MYCHN|nr:hypothetical protein [Mycoplasma haemocanis]AEW45371.1 hypothetical protein MHC_02535 [Mycoplasma haemocanis str. Illinois]
MIRRTPQRLLERGEFLLKLWLFITAACFVFLLLLKVDPKSVKRCLPMFLTIWCIFAFYSFAKCWDCLKDLINKSLAQPPSELRKLLVLNRNILLLVSFIDIFPLFPVVTVIPKLFFWRIHKRIAVVSS